MVDRRSGERILVDRSIKTPRGIAVTGDDQLIVVDADGGRLVRLTTGGSATVASGLRRPVGLFVDGDTDGWVTEYDTGRVSYVNLKTGLVRPLVVALGRPTAVVRLKTGNLAVVEAARGRVLSVDPKTGERTPIAGGLALAVDALDLPPDSVSGLAIAADGTLYVACPGDGSIVAIGPGVQ
jgi:sugar lactone lactonase YvrE